MRIRFEVGPAGVIKQVAGQSICTRVFRVMSLPIVPLGMMFVTDDVGGKQSGYKVPFFSRVGLTSLTAAYARAYLFVLAAIAVIALMKGSGGWGMTAFAAVTGALLLYFMNMGSSNGEARYRQLLLGFATGAAAEPEWLEREAATSLTAQIEATLKQLSGQSELGELIRKREGDIRLAAVSYAVARYRTLRDPGAKALALEALAWAQALLTLEALEQRVVTPARRIRGLSVEVSNSGVMVGGKRVFANPDGASAGAGASLVLLSDAELELGFLDRAGVELAMKQLLAGANALQVLGTGARRITLTDVLRVEAREYLASLTICYRSGGKEESCTVAAADLEQRAGLLEALKGLLGSRFAEVQKPVSLNEVVLAGGLMLLVVGLLGLLFWSYGIGKAVTLLGLGASLYWIVRHVRNPPLVTCVERRNTPSIAPTG
jgi:hypothetical protein